MSLNDGDEVVSLALVERLKREDAETSQKFPCKSRKVEQVTTVVNCTTICA